MSLITLSPNDASFIEMSLAEMFRNDTSLSAV